MASGTRTLVIDQASTILQDLPNGAAADYSAEAEDLNGADSNLDYLFEDNEDDTYPIAGLDTSFQGDLEDPAALLESLANYDIPPPLVIESRAPALPNDHHHFESLLQAAATAEGVEAAGGYPSQVGDISTIFDPQDAYEYCKRSSETLDSNKRKRVEEFEDDLSNEDSEYLDHDPHKHRKTARQEADQLALERELWGEEAGNEESTSIVERQVSTVPSADARAAGLHSATALFRRPSTASKKYTRAPMSKLFTSLELTAEQFLRLQSAAKAYMLDPNHPERSDCVGSRSRRDTDMVKLKLFACVKSFLEDEGWGAQCFTENLEEGRLRKLKWPKMKNKIISLVTPLMRRMVTNERQRLYALETRQEKRAQPVLARPVATPQTSTAEVTPQPETRPTQSVTPTQHPPVDPNLNEYHYSVGLRCPTNVNGQTNGSPKESCPSIQKEVDENGVAVSYLINLMYNGQRRHPQVTLKPCECPGFTSLVQHIHKITDGLKEDQQSSSIEALGPTGLVKVNDEESWKGAVASVSQAEWMDGEVKIVIQLIDRAF